MWGKIAEGMHVEAHRVACAKIGLAICDDWGCINIACMANPGYSREDLEKLIESLGGKPVWRKAVEFLIGHNYPSELQGTQGVPPSAALVSRPDSAARASEPTKQQPRIVSDETDETSDSPFPVAKIMAAIKETTDTESYDLTYTDTKGVMKEFWLWSATQKNNIGNRKDVANMYAMMLYDLHLRPHGKLNWSQKIFNRKRNGRRSNAQVSATPTPTPTHPRLHAWPMHVLVLYPRKRIVGTPPPAPPPLLHTHSSPHMRVPRRMSTVM